MDQVSHLDGGPEEWLRRIAVGRPLARHRKSSKPSMFSLWACFPLAGDADARKAPGRLGWRPS
jgi:hypothetical protein